MTASVTVLFPHVPCQAQRSPLVQPESATTLPTSLLGGLVHMLCPSAYQLRVALQEAQAAQDGHGHGLASERKAALQRGGREQPCDHAHGRTEGESGPRPAAVDKNADVDPYIRSQLHQSAKLVNLLL